MMVQCGFLFCFGKFESRFFVYDHGQFGLDLGSEVDSDFVFIPEGRLTSGLMLLVEELDVDMNADGG